MSDLDLELDLDYHSFVKELKKHINIDLSQYKETQMKRRLTVLKNKRGYHSFRDYLKDIVKEPNLMDEFLDRMTINVSEFWRNSNRWSLLEKKYIPSLLNGNEQLKCWSAGCSTGEEAYTLSMILANQTSASKYKIVASDLDERVLEKADKGKYDERSLRELPQKYHKYINKEQSYYKVLDLLKENIKFEKKNLLSDPFGSQFDLIICRNVMIYFTNPAKDLLYQKFSDALKPGGILFVGSTEQIFSPKDYQLETEDMFFYRKMKS
ncbi:CheR family methyltransferase [Chengkuizengella axinellae]|uniref:protein-glutamate O-methyltransferase n=1 Tax=Chengkuizengella axinellae TaxID=3064388 RepID=A0ABT9IWS2_9BACL|nr:protein-glutamate O-methyltransferase CheR [Chengkuizengella sp. 2205SS18-9]MDP5273802.1 protein-glutamate O-methyltransferase CheR [Chengkuizengella sp. 2205SS18-9]